MTELGSAFAYILTPLPMFYVILGVTLGIIVGAIPGLTGSMLIALTIPDARSRLELVVGLASVGREVTGGPQ